MSKGSKKQRNIGVNSYSGFYQGQEMPTSAAQAPRGDATSKQACNWLFGDTADFIYTPQMLLTQP